MKAQLITVNATNHSVRDTHGVIWYFNIVNGNAEIVGWKNTEVQTDPDTGEDIDVTIGNGTFEVPANVTDDLSGKSYPVTFIDHSGMTETDAANMQMDSLTFAAGSKAEMRTKAFKETQVKSINLKNYVGDFIPTRCFQGTAQLQTVDFNSTLTSIENYAFQASGLTTLALSQTQVHTIGTTAFEGCGRLSTVELPSTLTTLGTLAFRYCGSLTTIDLSGTGVTLIPAQCFSGCQMLADVKFNANITEIGGQAFADCPNLLDITFPASLNHITSNAFKGLKALRTVTFEGKTPPATFDQQAFANGSTTTLFYVPVDCSAAYRAKVYNATVKAYLGSAPGIYVADQLREKINVSKYGYTTYYLETENFKVPDGATAYVVTGSEVQADGKRHAKVLSYAAGTAVPKQTGFVLEALNAKGQTIDYQAAVTSGEVALTAPSIMKGTAKGQTYSGESGMYYVLSPDPLDNSIIGFFYQPTTKGKSFTLKPHQAGLFIADNMVAPAKMFAFGTGDFNNLVVSGINEIESDNNAKANNEVYDLQGRKVKNPTHGLYIVNGKKVFIK